ncbi:MAG: hypothetical protein MJZ70_05615 [Bacteroidales bacterium]|nr:hypothetical protein [Bacteroidales bacterium]
MKHNIFFKTLVLALLVAGGGTFTSCVKQKNCQDTRRTFIVEGELHYVSDEEAYLLEKPRVVWHLEPSDVPSKYQVDGILVRASIQSPSLVLIDDGDGINQTIYKVKCIESME